MALWRLCALLLLAFWSMASATVAAQELSPALLSSALPDDAVIVQGDIVVRQQRSGKTVRQSGIEMRGLALVSELSLWPNGLVPYRVDPQLSDEQKAVIGEAIAQWNVLSGVRLEPVGKANRDDPSSLANAADYIWFTRGDGCASWVGRQGGRQNIWIGENCQLGSVMHEIGHAFGLRHEHNRPDRDQHIEVLWDNILPEKRHNFEIDELHSTAVGAYDVGSIMHYGPLNFSIDGTRATLRKLMPGEEQMGQRIQPSIGDILALDSLYETDVHLSLAALPSQGGFHARVSALTDMGAHDLELTLTADTMLRPIGEGWVCDAPALEVRCRLQQLVGGTQSALWVPLASGEWNVSGYVQVGNLDVRQESNQDTLRMDVPGMMAMEDALPELAALEKADADLPPVPAADDATRVASSGGAMHPLLALLAGILGLARSARHHHRMRSAGPFTLVRGSGS